MYDIKNSTVSLRMVQVNFMTLLAYTLYMVLVLAVGLFVSCYVKEVTVELGGKTIAYHTFAPTVQDVIRETGIKEEIGFKGDFNMLAEGETVEYYSASHSLAAKVKEGMIIRVYKNRVTKQAVHEEIPAPIEKKWDIFLEPGQQRVVAEGKNGILENTFIIHYRDGVIVSEKKTDSKVITVPSARVIAIGSYNSVSRQGRSGGGTPMKFESTAYTHTGYRTATGAAPRRGIVAVDPRVIPMGTRLYIEGYGYGIAADTGGAIKGRMVDVFFETRAEAIKWGRRSVTVRILN